jgi:hypothetical protein
LKVPPWSHTYPLGSKKLPLDYKVSCFWQMYLGIGYHVPCFQRVTTLQVLTLWVITNN